LNAILLAAALQTGKSPLLGVTHMLVLSAFYGAHWAALTTSSLALESIGVSEAQWVMIAIHLITAMGPSDLWTKVILDKSTLIIGDAVGLGLVAVLVVQNYSNFTVVFGWKKTPLESQGICIPRRPFSLQPLLPWGIIMTGYVLCIKTGVSTSMALPVILIAGLSFAKASMRLMLEKFANRKHYGCFYDISTFCPLFLFASNYYSRGMEGRESKIAYTLVLLLLVDTMRFVSMVMEDLKRARNINVFSMRKGPGERYPKDTGFYVAGGNLASVQRAWQEFAADEKRVKATYGR
jgi:hypothetical protein